ncbi:MAG TPA: hypothetical protein VGK27_06735 [Candidatus Deferrimicrobiaceae bacterium]
MGYRIVHEGFWEALATFPAEVRLVAIYLETSPRSHFSGLFPLAPDDIAEEIGLSLDIVKGALNVLVTAEWIVYDDNRRLVYVQGMAERQAGGKLNSKQLASVFGKAAEHSEKSPCVQAIRVRYGATPTHSGIPSHRVSDIHPDTAIGAESDPPPGAPPGGVSDTHADTVSESAPGTKEKTEERKEKKEHTPAAAEAGRLARVFADSLIARVPKIQSLQTKRKGETLVRWSRDFQPILDSGVSPRTIEGAIRFALSHEFWGGRVSRPDLLQKHLDTILAQMTSGGSDGHRTPRYTDAPGGDAPPTDAVVLTFAGREGG